MLYSYISKGAADISAAPFLFGRLTRVSGQYHTLQVRAGNDGTPSSMTEEVFSAVSAQIFGIRFLIGAALVFWMQAGFAMVEAGFTRAKNAGNILMKNLMDFCIGTVVFILIGFGLLLGEDVMGLVGAKILGPASVSLAGIRTVK